MSVRPSQVIAAIIADHKRRHVRLDGVLVGRKMYAELCEEAMMLTQGSCCPETTELSVFGVPVLLEAEEGEVLQ